MSQRRRKWPRSHRTERLTNPEWHANSTDAASISVNIGCAERWRCRLPGRLSQVWQLHSKNVWHKNLCHLWHANLQKSGSMCRRTKWPSDHIWASLSPLPSAAPCANLPEWHVFANANVQGGPPWLPSREARRAPCGHAWDLSQTQLPSRHTEDLSTSWMWLRSVEKWPWPWQTTIW